MMDVFVELKFLDQLTLVSELETNGLFFINACSKKLCITIYLLLKDKKHIRAMGIKNLLSKIIIQINDWKSVVTV